MKMTITDYMEHIFYLINKCCSFPHILIYIHDIHVHQPPTLDTELTTVGPLTHSQNSKCCFCRFQFYYGSYSHFVHVARDMHLMNGRKSKVMPRTFDEQQVVRNLLS